VFASFDEEHEELPFRLVRALAFSSSAELLRAERTPYRTLGCVAAGLTFATPGPWGSELSGFVFLFADPSGRTREEWETTVRAALSEMGFSSEPPVELVCFKEREHEIAAINWFGREVEPLLPLSKQCDFLRPLLEALYFQGRVVGRPSELVASCLQSRVHLDLDLLSVFSFPPAV
jgi:hypothetical protein